MALNFTKRTYVDGETVITADNLNDMQDALLDLDEDKVDSSAVGAASGVASLDNSGKVPIGQLPVDSALSDSSANPVQNKVIAAALDGKAPVITDTASGAVASFPDGADGMPLESLVVQVEAVQSGSGDPAPDNFRPFSGWTGCQISHSGEDTSDPTVIPISWQTEAGTVYYGSVNIKTGVMTVEGGVNVYDGVNYVDVTAPEGGVVKLGKVTEVGRAGPDYYSFYTTNIRIGNFGSSTARILTPQEMSDGGFLCSNMPLCTMFETGAPTTTAQYAVGARLTAAGNVRIYIYARSDTGITTADQMNAKLAEWYAGNTPFSYCFRLKTPFTVQATPGQLFSTLYGVNNIWADCGPVAVEYPADTTLHIQKINAPIRAELDVLSGKVTQNTEDIADLDGELTRQKSAITNTTTKAIPCSFSSAGSTAELMLSGYTGKKVFVSNKNLLPQFPSYTNNGITFTPNADGSLSLIGTATSAATAQLTSNTMPNLGAGTYTLSCGNAETLGDSNTYLNVAIDGSYAAIYARLNSVDGQTTFTVPEGSLVTAIRIRISSGVTVPANFKIYPQCEEGTEKTAFVNHGGTVLNPTSASVEGVAIFQDYTYICAQSGVTGNVTFDASKFDEMQAEIDGLDARVTALENAPNVYHKFAGKKIICFGDSITGNYQPPADYPSMIAEITGATVYNAGFGGCCMSDNGQTRRLFTMCRLTDAIVAGDFSAQRNSGVSITYGGTSIDYVPSRLTMLEGIDWSDIDYITIAYGTNDWNSNYGLDNANDPLDTTTYIGAFRYSVEKLLAAYPNIKIMVLTPLWRWWDTNTGMPSEIHTDYIDSNDYAKGTGYKLWQYGDALVAAAKLYHIPVFDLYWNCMMFKQNRLEYFNSNDGTHPNLAGIQMMSEMIAAHLVSVY